MGRSGTCWTNIDPVTGFVKPGIDNSLITTPIDLTNARNAYLSAYFKFNFNDMEESPPDGFRVEISPDGGITWTSINLGVRTEGGVSGTAADNYWINASSLSRLNIDLSAWSGSQISVRFRMVTNNLPAILYPHYEDSMLGWGGFYVDDVQVYGETIFG